MASSAMTRETASGLGSELKTGAAPVPPERAEHLAREKYGFSGRAEWLWGEKDSNYRLTLENGTAYLMKILNPGEDPALTGMHSGALLHVEAVDPDIPVQRIVKTLDGEADFRIGADGGEARSVRMVTFLPGKAQISAPRSPLQRERIGMLMARLQRALESYAHRTAHHRISWDMKHAAGLRELFPVFADPVQRGHLERAMDEFESLVVPQMDTLRAQIIHNDFNMENILVAPDDPDTVIGIIDFGDMVHAPVLFDVAVGAAYQMGDEDDPVAAMCDFLKGYARLAKLSEREIRLLYPAVVMRLVMRVTIPEWRSTLFPQHRARYTRNSPAVWAQFSRLAAVSRHEAEERLAAAFDRGCPR